MSTSNKSLFGSIPIWVIILIVGVIVFYYSILINIYKTYIKSFIYLTIIKRIIF